MQKTDDSPAPTAQEHVCSTGKLGTTPHAVRWAQREIKHSFDMQYSRWHWTTNAIEAVCGTKIQLISDGPAMLPESDDRMSKVTCKRCLKLLPNSDLCNPLTNSAAE